MKKLISYNDFTKSNKPQKLKEAVEDDIEEIIPEGPLDEPIMTPNFNMNDTEKIDKIKDFIDSEPVDDIIDSIVNELRDVLLEMEQMGFVDEDTTDELDEEYDNDWASWIKAVIDLPDFPEEGLNNVIEIINNIEEGSFEFDDDEDEDVECPDCDGSGQNEEGEDCERCDGSGRVDRPSDIPPDDNYEYDDDEDDDEENDDSLPI